MGKKLLIRDLTIRDGQQSVFSVRMTQRQIDSVLPLYRNAGFYAMEIWGGAVPDAMMRHLNENPWDRLTKVNEAVGDCTKLTAISRGRNLYGYSPYPTDVIDGFNRNATSSGIAIMRIFDALNDTDNIGSSIASVKTNGSMADCAVCYTVDPYFSRFKKLKALLQAKPLNTRIFTDEYYIDKAIKYQQMGADIITLKDIGGLIPPSRAGRLVKKLKENLSVPLDFHTHCTPGYGLASILMAIVNGADIVDTCILSFSGGTAGATYEIIQLFCNKMGIETGVNPAAVAAIDSRLRDIRHELSDFDPYPEFPREFNVATDRLPKDIDELFELAIAFAKADKEEELLRSCSRIESYFNLPEPRPELKEAEVPGPMYNAMLDQLNEQKQGKLIGRVIELIPMVRMDSGCPPLVSPISQIIANQAVNCAIDEVNGKPFYTTRSIQFVNLVKGIYGKTPMDINPEFRYRIAGVREEVKYDTRYYKRQENPVFYEYGEVKLAESEKDELLLELFPSVAADFLKRKVEQSYLDAIHKVEEEKRRKFEAEKRAYELLSPEEKQQRLLDGLYHFGWTSDADDALGHS